MKSSTRKTRRPNRITAEQLKDLADLTPAEKRELQRRLTDLDNPTRYRLVSRLSPRTTLYYVLSDDTYVMNEPAFATLFKRRAAAAAIKAMLETNVKIEKCSIDRRGKAVRPAPAAKARSKRVKPRAPEPDPLGEFKHTLHQQREQRRGYGTFKDQAGIVQPDATEYRLAVAAGTDQGTQCRGADIDDRRSLDARKYGRRGQRQFHAREPRVRRQPQYDRRIAHIGRYPAEARVGVAHDR
jgi:hypothetical protein